MSIKKVLTIAGSDSGGGAGIQADLKTITVLGAFGTSAVTALTAQNTSGVQGIYEVSPDFVAQQIDSVVLDIGTDAAKTGMMANRDVIKVVSQKIKEHQISNVVVDPVMVAKDNSSLLTEGAEKALSDELIPQSFLVTPNIPEACVLSGIHIKDTKDMEEAAKRIYNRGSRNILIKGGHLHGPAVDILFDGDGLYRFESERIDTKNTHGTGCTYSAAIATFLAQDFPLKEAINKAKKFVTSAIRFSLDIGKGHGPTNHYAPLGREMERYSVVQDLKAAAQRLKEGNGAHLMPEVQSNLGCALPFAEAPEDVASFPGRLIGHKDLISYVFDPQFGISHHISRIILTAMRYDPSVRSAMNIRYSPEIVERCADLGFEIGSFDRRKEPEDIKELEGSSLAWGVERAIEKSGKVLDAIYDQGGWGKEPMVRILGKNPSQVVDKVLKIAKSLLK